MKTPRGEKRAVAELSGLFRKYKYGFRWADRRAQGSPHEGLRRRAAVVG